MGQLRRGHGREAVARLRPLFHAKPDLIMPPPQFLSETMGISLSATPILPVVDLPKLIHKIIMLPPGTRSLGYLTLDIALLRSEIRTPLFVLSVPAVTATIVRLILIPLIRVSLILLWRIIRSLLLRRSGDTRVNWQCDRDPPLLLLRLRERTPQERRNCP